MSRHLSPEEFKQILDERHEKMLEKIPKDRHGFILGNYFDLFYADNVLVECALCHIPLYVTPHSIKMSKQRNLPIICLNCAPWSIVKGALVQDLAAVLQYTGEK